MSEQEPYAIDTEGEIIQDSELTLPWESLDMMSSAEKEHNQTHLNNFIRDLSDDNNIGASNQAIGGLKDALGSLSWKGQLSPTLEEAVKRMTSSFGIIHAERFAEALQSLAWKKEGTALQSDIEECWELTLNAYRRLGKKAGSHFLWSYSQIKELNVNPKDYFHYVEEATSLGGRDFASKYATYLPDVMRLGADPEEFMTAGGFIQKKTSSRMAAMFLKETPVALKNEGKVLHDYTLLVEDGMRKLGNEVTYRAIPVLARAYRDLDIGGGRLVLDKLTRIKDEYGDKATGWGSSLKSSQCRMKA